VTPNMTLIKLLFILNLAFSVENSDFKIQCKSAYRSE